MLLKKLQCSVLSGTHLSLVPGLGPEEARHPDAAGGDAAAALGVLAGLLQGAALALHVAGHGPPLAVDLLLAVVALLRLRLALADVALRLLLLVLRVEHLLPLLVLDHFLVLIVLRRLFVTHGGPCSPATQKG